MLTLFLHYSTDLIASSYVQQTMTRSHLMVLELECGIVFMDGLGAGLQLFMYHVCSTSQFTIFSPIGAEAKEQ
jgi:hypothetical protein